ncbi:uncharacterized protein LOC119781550 [Cyprinodon tularosa]|uniref:uncharacterized protein LOC119781550 n=1 Tax=Cyprinodon tularosa TaxID=77115 RepID=UPI0018E2386B|nr:uncharacterized protein LOC119781550 [Cyprinodon tularosa]
MSFSLEEFVQAPSHEQLELCRKDDLLCLAEHFDISVKKHFSKAEIKNIVVQKLIEIKVLADSSKMDIDVCDHPSVDLGLPSSKDEGAAVMATPPKGLAEAQAAPATLPRFNPVSPELSGSSGSVKLKVRLARLQLEAQERELEEAQGKKVAYMLLDGLLLRRWAGENLEDWSAIYQVVVPTRFPEAVPLRRITAPMVTKALVKFFSLFGLPKVVQTDQDFSLPFKLDIDASAVGVGAVLLQDDKDGIEHPVVWK